MTTRMRHRHAAAVLVVAGVVVLSGCTAQEASDLPESKAVWPNGVPSGELSTSDEVIAVREAQEQLNNAIAFADFSDPALIAAVGYDEAQAWADWLHDERFADHPGPAQLSVMEKASIQVSFFEPLDAVPAENGGVLVHGCGKGSYALSFDVTYETWLVTTRGAGEFSARMLDANSSDTHGCEDVTIRAAMRDVPIALNDVGRDSVKMPLPREYYVELGVIDE